MYDEPPTSPWPRADIPPPPPPPAPYTRPNTLVVGLVASVTANVILLVCLLGVFLLARGGAFAPANSTARSLSGSATPTIHTSPSATSSPTLTPNWLQVAPTTVQLGCNGGQQAQLVVLTNSGPQDVQWQVDFVGSGDQSGINVSPNQGDLKAGASTTIQIQARKHASNQQGVIRFTSTTSTAGSTAGSAPSLSYSISGC